jgi:hypothetical protein
LEKDRKKTEKNRRGKHTKTQGKLKARRKGEKEGEKEGEGEEDRFFLFHIPSSLHVESAIDWDPRGNARS